jgi:hypothetical protein
MVAIKATILGRFLSVHKNGTIITIPHLAEYNFT